MIKVGMMIADRYEIIEKIGTGGMSDVYRAKDHKLNRFVAVKVLKQEFSENTDFVSKFRTEAQAAAGLMHPNIVNVYDVGEETGFHYIVMELVEGITLKKYIEKKARLSVKEAVSIAIQVSMGIESAHNNHIIHRDIKPQNIIISKEGKVKVTDFGIAKAATSNTITSNVMGSVHYTSPEQVRGGFSDEKSDIYSLGITLFEMLTGRVPFNGDTTVAVAIKHIQEKMPLPRDFVPEIPISVEQIVLKCTQKSPDKRYQSVPELVEDLKKSLISPDEDFVKIDTEDNLGVTKNISKEELGIIKDQTRKRDSLDQQMAQTGQIISDKSVKDRTGSMKNAQGNAKDLEKADTPKKKKKSDKKQSYVDEYVNDYPEDDYDEYDQEYSDQEYYQDDYSDNYEENWEEPDEVAKNSKANNSKKSNGSKSSKSNKSSKNSNAKQSGKNSKSGKSKTQAQARKNIQDKYEEEYDPKMEFLTTILIVVAAVIIGCIFLYIVARAVGLNLFQNDNNTNNNQQVVVGTDGIADTSANDANSGEDADVSDSQDNQDTSGLTVPSVIGLSRAEATAKLESEGFVVTIAMENSETVEKNNVISQNPENGSQASRGSTVEIKVSLGAGTTEAAMPNLINMSEDDAIITLTEKGLTVDASKITEEYSDTVAAGNICYQNYTAGVTINSSSEIILKVSKGPEQVYYNCITSVKAPNDYAGGAAVVTLKGSDGTQLFSTTTDTFPVSINVSNIFAVATGELYITYYVNEEEQLTDGDGNITIQNVQVQKTIGPETITFTRAQ